MSLFLNVPFQNAPLRCKQPFQNSTPYYHLVHQWCRRFHHEFQFWKVSKRGAHFLDYRAPCSWTFHEYCVRMSHRSLQWQGLAKWKNKCTKHLSKKLKKLTKPGIFVLRCSAWQRYLGRPSASRPPSTGLFIDSDPPELSPQNSAVVETAANEKK